MVVLHRQLSRLWLLWWQIFTTWGWLVLWTIHVLRKLLLRGRQVAGIRMMLICAHHLNAVRWVIRCMVVHGNLRSLWRPMQVPCHHHRQEKTAAILWPAVDVQIWNVQFYFLMYHSRYFCFVFGICILQTSLNRVYTAEYGLNIFKLSLLHMFSELSYNTVHIEVFVIHVP